MSAVSISRRTLVVAASASAAILSLRDAIAQSDATSGDWLAMVKTHHALISKTFDQMLDAKDRTFLRREQMQRLLSYQLTAHSVAEENVLYPALARVGLVSESDKLYLDQAHAKVKNAELALVSVKDEGDWVAKVSALQAAVLQHAKTDEEGDLYPKLRQRLEPAWNASLAAAYKREFDNVKRDLPAA